MPFHEMGVSEKDCTGTGNEKIMDRTEKQIFMKHMFTILVVWMLSAVSLVAQQEEDRFARIAMRDEAVRWGLLREVVPMPLPEVYLPTGTDAGEAFSSVPSLSTAGELENELQRMRDRYAPFLRDLAPAVREERIRVPLRHFYWRVETPADRSDFFRVHRGEGDWKKVAIPHYGPPLGRAVTYYYRTFRVTPDMMRKGSIFLHFDGVDYKAHVFVNGAYIGSHEGFFAPFEFPVTGHVKVGENTLVVKVENDHTTTSRKGDKIYAATGPGYDDPREGWHHCPPGMGIYQPCYLEARSPLHIRDLFVRPVLSEEKAEVWIEVNNYFPTPRKIRLSLSVYGQNFDTTVVEGFRYRPHTVVVPGLGDLAKPTDWESKDLPMGYGVNFLKVTLPMKGARLWEPGTPWLYQLQVRLYDEQDELRDVRKCQFGMRSFTMDTLHTPKGRMFLNGKMIRLRGANTMGAFQQDVMRGDTAQLRDDILLAKILGLNYLRMTQRPVQKTIYDYCDRLGMMTQTDLPLFGTLRTNQWAEAVRQAGEMERLVRNHPCNILVTYINERFPNAEGSPQRAMSTAEEYYRFFRACDQAVHMANPDRVIKAGDGDYDPPSPGLPDNHCYNAWYNSHGLPLGKMHKGYWQPVKPGWYYACGEFGAEGLDNYPVMKKYYPAGWLPASAEEEKTWTPGVIAAAQTWRFHYMWFNAQHSVHDWIEASQEHQAWATRMYAEAFRLDSNMVSFAIHLFIDAWPAGWMKAIMDVDRQPKKAFFVYRDLLKPLVAILRTDRYHYFSGQEILAEAWVAHDCNTIPRGYRLKYQFLIGDSVVFANSVDPVIPVNSSRFQGYLRFPAPQVRQRTPCRLMLALFDEKGEGVSQSILDLEIFPPAKHVKETLYLTPAGRDPLGIREMEEDVGFAGSPAEASAIIVSDYGWYDRHRKEIDALVRKGHTVLFGELLPGKYRIGNTTVEVEKTHMGEYFFASPRLQHPLVNWAQPLDFRFWYDEEKDYVTPFLGNLFRAEGWSPVITSGNPDWRGDNGEALAVGEYPYGEGVFRICQLRLNHRLRTEPVARLLLEHLISPVIHEKKEQ